MRHIAFIRCIRRFRPNSPARPGSSRPATAAGARTTPATGARTAAPDGAETARGGSPAINPGSKARTSRHPAEGPVGPNRVLSSVRPHAQIYSPGPEGYLDQPLSHGQVRHQV